MITSFDSGKQEILAWFQSLLHQWEEYRMITETQGVGLSQQGIQQPLNTLQS